MGTKEEKGKDYDYVFMLIDLERGMYVGFGYSKTSDREAFNKAMRKVEKLGIAIDSIFLDKYYSSRKALRIFDRQEMSIFSIHPVS